jgi:hypothetical protein
LRRRGIRTMRIWEHSAASGKWLPRLLRMIHETSLG